MTPSDQPPSDPPSTGDGSAPISSRDHGRATDPAEDARLLAAAREGDDAAFAVLIQRHDPMLRRLTHHLLDGRGTDAALIDAYVKAYRGLGRQRGDVLPWLTRTTYLACLDRVRRREQRRRGGPGRKPVPREAPAAEHPLTDLPPDQQLVIALIDGCHLSLDVAAASLAVPDRTIEILLDRGRRALSSSSSSSPSGRSDELISHAPDPPEDFWRRLGVRLLAERASPAAKVPPLPRPDRLSSAQRRAEAPPLAMQRRAPRHRRFRPEDSFPDPVEGLAVGARRRRRRLSTRARTNALHALGILLAASLIGATVVAVVRVASRAKSPVRENSVAEISRRSTAAMAELDRFGAIVTRTLNGSAGRRVDAFRLVRNRAGSFLMAGSGTTPSVAYDAPTDTLRRSGPNGSQETGLAAGPPDPSGFDGALPDADVSQALRACAEVEDEAAVAERVDGVDVWTLEAPVPDAGDADDDVDRVTLSVDRAHLAPVRVAYRAGDVVVRSVSFRDVVLDGLVPTTFSVDPGPEVRPLDRGFRSLPLSAVDAAVGRAPLRPAFLPPGYELAAVTVRTEGATVALRYQRGFERVVVTTRSSPVPREAVWADPFDRGARVGQVGSVALDEGPFRQTTARRVAVVGALPSIWGSDGNVAFTVSGDLDADQLVRVAESLRP